MTWSAKVHEYIHHLAEDGSICVYIMVKVEKTGQIFTAQKTFTVDKPDLDLKVAFLFIYLFTGIYIAHFP